MFPLEGPLPKITRTHQCQFQYSGRVICMPMTLSHFTARPHSHPFNSLPFLTFFLAVHTQQEKETPICQLCGPRFIFATINLKHEYLILLLVHTISSEVFMDKGNSLGNQLNNRNSDLFSYLATNLMSYNYNFTFSWLKCVGNLKCQLKLGNRNI